MSVHVAHRFSHLQLERHSHVSLTTAVGIKLKETTVSASPATSVSLHLGEEIKTSSVSVRTGSSAVTVGIVAQ